jgi:DNA-binding NarL/FixJ family response regulator
LGPPQRGRPLLIHFPAALGQSIREVKVGRKHMSPRVAETLACLLEGLSEKEVATKLRLSPHTVHVYVRQFYKIFGVSSRAELMVKCLQSSL